MTYVVTRSCCNDASCMPVCPVNCIHPTPDEPGFAETEMVYIDPDTCIDCGACLAECPVEAIVADYDLLAETERYLEINARYYQDPAHQGYGSEPYNPPVRRVEVAEPEPLRVAVVGTGPAACYAAEALMSFRGLPVEIHMFDRLATPWGLVRHGVAPDHQATKEIAAQFGRTVARQGVSLHLNVEVGCDITHAELMEHHHAVLYAVGASQAQRLDIPGEDLPGSMPASEIVAWYNGHPDARDLNPDLSAERAVVIGNGNVALDVARILLSDPAELASTDIADHAREALAASAVREVVVLGRRGPAQASYSVPELLSLLHHPGFDVVVDPVDVVAADDTDPMAALRAELVAEIACRPSSGASRRLVLRYLTAPEEILGRERVTGIRTTRTALAVASGGQVVSIPTGENEVLDCGLVIRSVGYRCAPVPGVPFDRERGIIPNVAGRVVGPDGAAMVGLYVAGWAKRGPRGVIGTNRVCSEETVDALVADHLDGRLPSPPCDPASLSALLTQRAPDSIDFAGWRAIDTHERTLGKERGRPRTKLVSLAEMLALTGAPTPVP